MYEESGYKIYLCQIYIKNDIYSYICLYIYICIIENVDSKPLTNLALPLSMFDLESHLTYVGYSFPVIIPVP